MATLSINIIHNTHDYDIIRGKKKCPGAPRHQDHYQFSFNDFYHNHNHIPQINIPIIPISNFIDFDNKKYKTCPSPPYYSKKNETHDFPSEGEDFSEIESMYQKIENSYVVKNDMDNNYIPDGTRILVGKKFYKFADDRHKIINMKQIFLLVKNCGKWKRSNIVLERRQDESNEWDISFN